MKKTDKTALTAAMFAAAINLIPMGASAYDPENEPIQDVYGPPVVDTTYAPETEPIQDVYGPPWMFTESTVTATDTMPVPVTTFQTVYGPPEVISSMLAEREKYTTTTMPTYQPVYGPAPIYDTTTLPPVTSEETITTAVTEDPIEETTERFEPVYGPAPIIGDFNYDRKIDSFDMVAARQMYVKSGGNMDRVMWNSDMNNDGKFGVADLVMLSRYLLGVPNALEENIEEPEQTTVTSTERKHRHTTTTTVATEPVVTRETEVTYAPVYGPPPIFNTPEAE